MTSFGAAVDARFNDVEKKAENLVAQQTEMQQKYLAMEQQIAELRANMQSNHESVEKEISKVKVDLA
eukprot:15199020-Alexandrium_andersonii.AAC.1